MKIADLMTPECKYLKQDDSLVTAAQLMAENDFGSVPITNDEQLVGMITDRDIVIKGVAKGIDANRAQVGELIDGNVFYCFDDQDCDEVAANMGQLQIRRMPVVNREKRLVGVVSLGDLSTRGAKSSAGEALSEISETTETQDN